MLGMGCRFDRPAYRLHLRVRDAGLWNWALAGGMGFPPVERVDIRPYPKIGCALSCKMKPLLDERTLQAWGKHKKVLTTLLYLHAKRLKDPRQDQGAGQSDLIWTLLLLEPVEIYG